MLEYYLEYLWLQRVNIFIMAGFHLVCVFVYVGLNILFDCG
jgi:hypothetical protein